MVTYDRYLSDVAGQVLGVHESLLDMPDGPATLEALGREDARVRALFGAIVARVGSESGPSRAHSELAAAAGRYLESYSFAREISSIAALYSDDRARVRNIRLKMIESLEDGGLAGRIRGLLEEMA